jgi:hypothetical protein
MSTKLNKATIDSAKQEIASLLDCGVRFTKLNMTSEEMGEFWHRGFPDELLDAYTVLAKHGVGIEYHAVSSSIGFAIPIDPLRAMSVRLTIAGGNGGFINLTRSMAKDHAKIHLDGAGQAEAWPVIDQAECEKRMGQAKWQEFWAWAQAADHMSREIANALDVSTELLDMVKTAGQLQRMAPDFLQYVSAEQRAALSSQKRASQLPYEWAAYDRAKVDAALVTLGKCQLVRGLVDDSTKHMHFGGDQYSWAIIRDVKAQPQA